jgi:RIO kinase 1
MPHRFCAICGSELKENAPHFGMCLNCYLKENPLFELPKSYNLKLCIDCLKYAKKEEWYEPSENEVLPVIEEALSRFLLKNYLKQDLISFSFTFDNLAYSSKDLLTSLEVTVRGVLTGNHNFTHQETLKVTIGYELCKNCSNLRGGMYYLSILQLRVKDKNEFNVIKEVLDDISRLVESLFSKDNKQYIAKMEDQPLGVDLYLSTNELLNRIISHIRAKYHFILKRTKKLVGRDSQRGRNLYRLKALVKFLPFKRNEFIYINNIRYYVESLTKNKVILRDEKQTKLVKNFPYFFEDRITIKKVTEDEHMEKKQEELISDEDDFFEGEDDNDLDTRFYDKELDDLEKRKVDSKRIKNIDQTKKRATVDSVLDERMYLQLNKLLKAGTLDRIEGIISAGKEANVYLAYGPNNEEYAVKIYKIDTNTSKWMRNYIIGDERFKKVPNNVSKIIYLWASKEYKNLKRAYKAGLSVPEPILVKNNILIMEYIGFESIPAPKLKDIKTPKDSINLLNEILYFIKNLYQKAKLVHGDLSEFNILYHNQKPVVIDISQAVTIYHPKAVVYLERDITNICNYFERIGVEVPNREDRLEFYKEVINID